jgi:hypothetical protein
LAANPILPAPAPNTRPGLPTSVLLPDRGVISPPGSSTGQPDIAINGISYLHRVSDAVTKEALHIGVAETVRNPDGSTFLQLQYTQRVLLHFGIDWPHISVATLTKQ